MARYTYGDSPLARERLGLVAAMFEPASRAFLEAVVADPPGLALDVGCGPGHSTRMLAQATGSRLAVGIDRSEAFIRSARDGAPAGLAFAVADAMVAALPARRPDLIYARLLLAHLSDPTDVIRRWSTSLTIGGLVLIDDLEMIETDEPSFRAYLDDVALAVVRSQGGALFVGPALRASPDLPAAERVHDAVATLVPDAASTARIFAMNLAVLVERGEAAPRPDLAAELAAIAEGRRAAAPPRWQVAQIAWRRTR